MANYEKARVKVNILNSVAKGQLNKLKSAAKSKTGTTLKTTKKNVQDEKLSRELFLY